MTNLVHVTGVSSLLLLIIYLLLKILLPHTRPHYLPVEDSIVRINKQQEIRNLPARNQKSEKRNQKSEIYQQEIFAMKGKREQQAIQTLSCSVLRNARL